MGAIALITKELEKILSKYPSTGCLLFPYYKGMVEKEIQMGNITEEDKVLCIGGGSYPCTALEIARKTGASVEVIDIDPVAIKNSKKVIKKLQLDEKVKVSKESGQRIDPSSFTVIHIARQACPQEEILNNILKKSSDGTRILMRSPRSSLESIYTLLHRPHYCQQYCCREEKYNMIKATLLYIKNLGGKKNEKTSPVYSGDIVSKHHSLAG